MIANALKSHEAQADNSYIQGEESLNETSEENMMQSVPKMKTNNNFNVLLNKMSSFKVSENPQTSGAPLVVESPVTYATH